MASTSVQQPVRFDTPLGATFRRRRRALYTASTIVLSLIVVSALFEDLFGLPLYGVDHAERTASDGGTVLTVRYPRVARGQLDSQLTITARRSRGFDGDVTIAISGKYLDAFSIRRVTPSPTSENQEGDAVMFTFDTPPGDSLVAQWDLAARPTGWFSGLEGRATMLGGGSNGDLSVGFRSDLRP